MLGSHAEARPWSDGALALLEDLHAQDAASHANLLAGTLLERASVLQLTGDCDGQHRAQARAVEVLHQHLLSNPGHSVSQRDLVRAMCGLCGVLQQAGRIAEAEATLSKARSLANTLPAITDEERAIVDRRLGLLYASTSRAPEAVAALTSSIALTEKLARRHPGRMPLRVQLRDLQTLLYEQLHHGLQYAAADAQAALAIAAAEALAPDHPRSDSLLADTLSRLAWAPVAADRDVPVDAWIERCLELTEAGASADGTARAARERALVARRFAAIRDDLHGGRLDAARSALEALTEELHDAEWLLRASCSWATMAGAIRAGEAPDQAAIASAEAAALAALARAVEHGLADRRRLLACAELVPLESRPAFRAILARLPE
jgi:hypothetical protein